MKALLFIPKVYSLAEMIQDGFNSNGWEATVVDFQNILPHSANRFFERTAGLPNRITKYWKNAYFKLINDKYLQYCDYEKPDIALIYNNQYFYPDTIKKIRKNAKIVFILGDNPLWSTTFDFNLAILKCADLVISGDSHWQNELSSIGIPNIVCDYIGYSPKRFFRANVIDEQLRSKYHSDILFIGRNYSSALGYKRTLFLRSFSGMNFKIFGSSEWNKWLSHFPELKQHFNLQIDRISLEEYNLALNCAKIFPIDQNTGIINGIHLRVFEIIGAGTLPIVEWRSDIDKVFGELLPVIKNYNDSKQIVEYYLTNEKIRKETISALRFHVESNYTSKIYVKHLIENLTL